MSLCTVYTEKKIVAALLQHLESNGWSCHKVWDGVEFQENLLTHKDVLDAVFSVDGSRLYVSNKDAETSWILLISGNGSDIISDYSLRGIDKIMESFCDSLTQKLQDGTL
jgi:hypothetical protein